MKVNPGGVSRRDFMAGAVAVGAIGGLTILGAAARGQEKKTLSVGLVGCGSRGRGAIINHLDAVKYLNELAPPVSVAVRVAALADVYDKPLQLTRERLKQDDQEVPDNRCFLGFDGYKKLIDCGVDVVLLATPPVFRPLHFEAAVKAGKHVFMEKPVCVDPAGGHRVIAAGEEAKKKNLSVVAGTQRRHQAVYLAAKKLMDDGVVGGIWGGAVYWAGASSWVNRREPGWSDTEYIMRNWINFSEMSGDHIVEQHVHNLDVMVWFMGAPPTLAVAVGGRARRQTGNCYDFFSTDFLFKNGVHIQSLARQVNGAWSREGEELVGDKGIVRSGRIKLYSKEKVAEPEIPGHRNPYVQEHVDLIDSIVKEKPLNEAEQVTHSTLAGVMGRLSAYTGQPIRFSDVADPEGRMAKLALSPSPEDFETGNVKVPPDDVIPVPGKAE